MRTIQVYQTVYPHKTRTASTSIVPSHSHPDPHAPGPAPEPTSHPAPLAPWAAACESLGATTKKLEKRALLADYLHTLTVADAARAAQYTAGTPFSEADPRQLNVGGSLLAKAVAARSGASPEAMTHAFRRHGDIGAAAEDLIAAAAQPPAPPPLLDEPDLTLAGLEQMLTALAEARGPAAKLRELTAFLARASALETKYILKLISGDMRIGVKQSLVEEAIGAAYTQPLAAVRHAHMLLGSLPEVVERAAANTLDDARMRLFHPLGFMLASPVDSVDEAIARFAQEVNAEVNTEINAEINAQITAEHSEAAAEGVPEQAAEATGTQPADPVGFEGEPSLNPPELALREAQMEDKYDGMRAQLHAGDPASPGRVALFSRNREPLLSAFPELTEAFAALSEPTILDGEILAWQPATAGSPARALPFSSLQQRLGRKQVSGELRRSSPVVFMAFDILYADGTLLLDQPLHARRTRLEQYLAQHALQTDGRTHHAAGQQALFTASADEGLHFPRLLLAPTLRLASAAQLDAAYLEARARGNEGVMLKASGSLYQPGRRGLAWLKLKRELATLDVVVTGAEFGTGRRAGYLSDYTFAVRGPDGDLLNVGKAYSGVTDAEMYALSEHFHATTLDDHGHFRTVEPDTVFEIAFNNITRSTRHASGFALRFPRILRIRSDKPIQEIDTLARVEELYQEQPDRPVEPGDPSPPNQPPA